MLNNIKNETEQRSNPKPLLSTYIGFEGQGKLHTVKTASLETGIPQDTIRAHLREYGSNPNWDYLQVYMDKLPIAFASALMSPIGFRVNRMELTDAPTTMEAQVSLMDIGHKVALALLDGHVCDFEKKKLTPCIRKAAHDLLSLADKYDKEVG